MEHSSFSASPPDSLLNQPTGLRFSLEQQTDVTVVDGLDRVRPALGDRPERNRLTKRSRYSDRNDELAAAIAQGDHDAFNEFVLLHRPLARLLSKWLRRRFRLDADDAEQIGVIGLISAARRFDPGRGIQFSTYASHWIRQSCQRYGPDAAMSIRLPSYIRHGFIPLRRQFEKLANELGRGRANDELAKWCAEDTQFFPRWLAVDRALNVGSLSDRSRRDYYEALELPAAAKDEPLQVELDRERLDRMRAAIACLSTRERRIVERKYGIDGKRWKLTKLGKAERLRPWQVRQILSRAERKLRTCVESGFKDLVPARAEAIGMAESPSFRSDANPHSRAGRSTRR